MSSTAAPPPKSRARRVPFLVAATLTGVIALGLLVSSAALLWADSQKDADGYFSTDRETLRTDTPALVSDNLRVNLDSADWLVDESDLGDVRVSVEPQTAESAFVGVARTADVRRYLDRTAHTTVTDIDSDPFGFGDYDAAYETTPGAARADRPADQRFWTASASGRGTQELKWAVDDGDWSVVVMNADGTSGVKAGVAAGTKVNVLDELGWIALGGGVLFVLVTAGLIALGTRPYAAAASSTPRNVSGSGEALWDT